MTLHPRRAFQADPESRSSFRIRFQQIIAHVGSRKIHLGANIVQHAIPEQELAPDLIVLVAELVQNAQSIESRQGDNGQKAAKAHKQREPALRQLGAAVPNIEHSILA